MLQGAATVDLRFQPGQFSGFAVMHCHFLSHEGKFCCVPALAACAVPAGLRPHLRAQQR